MTINIPISAAAISRAMSFDSLLISKAPHPKRGHSGMRVVSCEPDVAACESMAALFSQFGYGLALEPSDGHKAYHAITGTW